MKKISKRTDDLIMPKEKQNGKFDLPGDRSGYSVILRTKIHKPPIRKEFVERSSLIERLEKNVTLPLTLISSATGCGKSITASQWLESKGHPYGWLSLDEEHNNPDVLLTYLVSLLKEQWPEQKFGTESLLHNANIPTQVICNSLINDLDQLEDLFILVLDDYHMIKEDKIHHIINGILRYPPEHLHLVILTQQDPPLELGKMRSQLRLHEIRMKDLAFSKAEVLEFSTRMSLELTGEQISAMVKNTDGWVTGITAGLLVLADGVEFDRVIQSLINPNSAISQLLDEVVLKGLSVAAQKFLELTVLVDRFSPELIDAMIASIDDPDLKALGGNELVEFSKRRNLFLIPLDASEQWYRYHHVFRDQIRKRNNKHFKAEVITQLYKSASSWFNKQKYTDEALKCAIASKDLSFAVHLFDSIRHELFNSEQFQRLDRLIDLFPKEAQSSHIELSVSRAMLQDYKGNFSGMQECLTRASLLFEENSKQIPDDESKNLKGEYHSVSSFLPYIMGEFDQCITESEKALSLLTPKKANYFREFALAYYVFARQAQGKTSEGLEILKDHLNSLSIIDPYFKGRLLQLQAMVYGMEADTKNMFTSALELNALVDSRSFPGAWMAGIYYLAVSDYIGNKPEDVDRFQQELWQNRYAGRPFWIIHNIIVSGLASLALGRYDQVKKCIDQCLELSSELEIKPLKGMVHAFEVEVALRRNDLERANQLSALANFEPHPPIFYFYSPQLTRIKLFLRSHRKGKALELLRELLSIGETRNNVNLLIQALLLKAIMHADEGDIRKAKSALNKALRLSHNKKVIRPFLDLGYPVYQLLKELKKDKQEDLQIDELLEAFRKETDYLLKKEQLSTGTKVTLGNSLSDRELEILILVTKGYKNLEIAERLFVSVDTVKKHLYNAYQKLYVKNRVGAINKLHELGIIEQE